MHFLGIFIVYFYVNNFADNVQTYVAVYSFEAENENQMSLVPDDIVLVAETEDHEGWLCGWKEDSGKTGWFPRSHVREVVQVNLLLPRGVIFTH